MVSESGDQYERYNFGAADGFVYGVIPCNQQPQDRKLDTMRDLIEPGRRIQTEPDVVLHVPGVIWIFVEAKVASPVTTFSKNNQIHKQRWIERYRPFAMHLFDFQRLDLATPKSIPEQLLRNVVFADRMCTSGERAIVVALMRRKNKPLSVATQVRQYLSSTCPVEVRAVSWEDLYSRLPRSEPKLASLISYFEEKSVNLRKAFDIP
jgi:hypothetical protein